MPPRKTASAPAVTVAVVPPDPDAGVTFADHRTASAMMLRALAGLDPAAALDRLRALYASLPNGTARRAVLAARLAILRDNLPARIMPAPMPVVPPSDVAKPAMKAGALSTLALETAARLLMEAGAEEAPPPRAAKAPPPVADLFAALAAADADDDTDLAAGADVPDGAGDGAGAWGGPIADEPDKGLPEEGHGDGESAVAHAAPSLDARDATSPDAPPDDAAAARPTAPPDKPARPKAKARKPKALSVAKDVADADAMDRAGATGDNSDDDSAKAPAFVPTPPKSMASALSVLAALDEDGPPVLATVPATVSAAAFDLGAAFAALAESDDAPHTAPEVPSFPLPERSPSHAVDDIAASLSALIGEGDDAAAPDMPDKEVSKRLGAIDGGGAAAVEARPKRALPTDLSDVSAAFAAWDDDTAE